MATLYDTWLNRIDSYYEERYYEPVVEALCQYHGGSVDGRDGKGKIFNAGYEVFIVAFFIGLYYGERTPLKGPKRKFRMEMYTWGRKSTENGRKDFTLIQKYIFAALIAKSDIDLLAVDKGDLSLDEACDILMTTLNEYANTGFLQILPLGKEEIDPKLFESTGLLEMVRNFCGK